MRGGYIASVSLPPQEKSNHCFGNIFEVFVDRAGNTFLIGPWWSGDVRANHGRRQNCQAEQKCRDQEGNADLTKIQRDLHSSCMWGEAKYKIRKAGIAIWCLTIQLIYVNRSNLKYNVFFFPLLTLVNVYWLRIDPGLDVNWLWVDLCMELQVSCSSRNLNFHQPHDQPERKMTCFYLRCCREGTILAWDLYI